MSLSVRKLIELAQRDGYTLKDVTKMYLRLNAEIVLHDARGLVTRFVCSDYEAIYSRLIKGETAVYVYTADQEVRYEPKDDTPHVKVELSLDKPVGCTGDSMLQTCIKSIELVGLFPPQTGVRQAVCLALGHSSREVANGMLDIAIQAVKEGVPPQD